MFKGFNATVDLAMNLYRQSRSLVASSSFLSPELRLLNKFFSFSINVVHMYVSPVRDSESGFSTDFFFCFVSLVIKEKREKNVLFRN